MKLPWPQRWPAAPVIGIAVTDRAVWCAQLRPSARGPVVQQQAHWKLPESGWNGDVTALAGGLRATLKEHGLSARHAIVGVPAKWLVAHSRDLPPADASQARALLRLQLERQANGDADLVYDCVGEPGGASPSRVLLLGMLRSRRDRVLGVMQGAGLEVRAITATTLALCRWLAKPTGTAIVLVEQGAEIVAQQAENVTLLRHLSLTAGGEPLATAADEIRRALAMAPPSASGHAPKLVHLESCGWSAEQAARLCEQLGLGGPAEVSLPTGPGSAASAAAAVALAGWRGGHIPADFLHPSLAAAVPRRVGRKLVLAVAAALAVALGLVSLYVSVLQRESQAVELADRLKRLAPDIAVAQAAIERTNTGRGYYRARPPVLECLREITLAIPPEDPLWVTSFQFHDGKAIQLVGKAANQQVVLSLLDRLRGHARFTEVQLQDLRDGGGRTREWTFSIALTFLGEEAAP